MADFLLDATFVPLIALCGLSAALLIQCGNKRKAPRKKAVKGQSKKSSRSKKSTKDSVSSSKSSKKPSRSSKHSNKEADVKTAKQKSNRSKRSDKESKSDAIAKPTSTQEKKPKRELLSLKALQEMKNGPEAANNSSQLELHLDQTVLRFGEKGGLLKVQLHNPTSYRQAIKAKCSDNNLYRLNPVYGYVEPGQTMKIEILRQGGNSKVDKLLFVTAKAPSGDFDVKKLFKSAPKEETPCLLLLLLA